MDDKSNEPITYITNRGYYGTYTKENLERFTEYAVNKDKMAIDMMLLEGTLFLIPTNKTAFLIKSSWGSVKIRLKGSTREIWTVKEAISEK